MPSRTSLLNDILNALPADYKLNITGTTDIQVSEEEFQEAHISGNALNMYPQALDAGARILFVSKTDEIIIPADKAVTIIRAEKGDLNTLMALVCRIFYADPFRGMKIIGITGTKGKTTTCQILESIYSSLGYKTGYIGTIGVFTPSQTFPPGLLSNPTATDIFEFGDRMRHDGVQIVFMEVTSHGMYYRRNAALNFHTAVFTNLSADHLDFHISRDDYKKEKLKFFKAAGANSITTHALFNADESEWTEFYDAVPSERIASGTVKPYTYGIKNKECDFTAYPEEMTGAGSRFRVYFRGNYLTTLSVPLPGLFNIYNALAAFACAATDGEPTEKTAQALASAGSVKGRFERVENPAGIQIFIDYAHTADSLKNLLTAVRPLTGKKLICVFGCGGDRDRTKRPLMGMIAAEFADEVRITSDNPRTEEPAGIISEIRAGIPKEFQKKVYTEIDRAQAIRDALAGAGEGDTVVIAGKGQEQYQIIRKKKIFFSDREEVEKFFRRSNDLPPQTRGVISVSSAILKKNLKLLLNDMPDGVEFMAVVKDDALGIGMINMAGSALNFGASYLCCSNVQEAEELRSHFPEAPVLILGERADYELETCVRQKFSLQMQSAVTLKKLHKIAEEQQIPVKIHIKADTGMSRYGLKPEEVPEFFRTAAGMPFIEIEGLMTHFAQSDEADKTFARQQIAVFNGIIDRIRQVHPLPKYIHACNSGGYLDLPEAHYNMVRMGTLLTGIYPSKVCRRIKINGEELESPIVLKSHISFDKILAPGDSVGYGMRFTAEKPMTVAVIPIGYGDGYPRLRNKGRVLIKGRSAPIIGGVSLDAMIVDITHITGSEKGTPVTLIGKDGSEEITVMELADYAGTVTITTEWGAGPKLVAGFEKQCGCKLKIKGLEDGAAILTRVRLEQKNPIADVVLGLDGGLSAEATDSGLFIPHGISLKNLNALPRAWDNPLFLPYDYGWLAFVYRKDKLTHPPGSLKDLISSKQKSPTLIIQDPRVSTPGLGLLLWIKQIYGKDAGQAWSALAKRTVTVTPGWSEAYALFIKGEADMVLSYTTSPAYHRLAEQDDRYGAVLFEEGNYFQTELAAILKSSPKQKLA
ncbi:hypothetical protein CHS0354_006940 [Potamilus streckersoni]|uniref:Alanine racemase C-terminal domain-containing protein n=1 Tax=Potamilus streckersoni TaxID=2493646 RepID=A0AAE0TF86_9BIVA|nr:hypothetical protein CHS0354_006940 [Potamilus streckersoni]